MPSTSGDLFSFIELILLATTSRVKINCSNLSVLVQLNFVSGVGNELIPFPVNPEPKSVFNSYVIKYPCVIIFPAVSSSAPTLSRTLCLLFTKT